MEERAELVVIGFPARIRESWCSTYPIIVGSLSTVALVVVDTAILGRYSTDVLAVMGLVLPLFVFASAMIVPWGTAVQILVARWQGADDYGRINRMLDTGLFFCMAVARERGTGVEGIVLWLAISRNPRAALNELLTTLNPVAAHVQISPIADRASTTGAS